jgi:hypothetical protein
MLTARLTHHVLVWGPAAEGERTSTGRVLPAGWVWSCSCGLSGVGFPSEDEAGDDSETHEALWQFE